MKETDCESCVWAEVAKEPRMIIKGGHDHLSIRGKYQLQMCRHKEHDIYRLGGVLFGLRAKGGAGMRAGWIPVYEACPPTPYKEGFCLKSERILVTGSMGVDRHVYMAEYRVFVDDDEDLIREWMDCVTECAIDAVAWKPLPEAYEP